MSASHRARLIGATSVGRSEDPTCEIASRRCRLRLARARQAPLQWCASEGDIDLKALVASLALNLALALALGVALLRPSSSVAPSSVLAPTPQSVGGVEPNVRGAGVDVAAPPVGHAPTDAAAELALCKQMVRSLNQDLGALSRFNLDQQFEGGEDNQALAARVRTFFPASARVECRDLVCHVDEADDEETRRSDEALLRDPWFAALSGAERLGPGDHGGLRRTVKVAGDTLDGEKVLTRWLGVSGLEALASCDALQGPPLQASARIDGEGRIQLDDVTGGPKARCVKEQLLAHLPKREPLPVRAATAQVELPAPR